MKKSPYRELAERIEGNIEGRWFCCKDLPKENAKTFQGVFHPSPSELKQYNHIREVWMGARNTTQEQDNGLRILALLFMDEFVKTVEP